MRISDWSSDVCSSDLTAKSVRLFAIRSPDYNAVSYAIRIWIRWATGDKDFPMIKRWLLSFAAAPRWPDEGRSRLGRSCRWLRTRITRRVGTIFIALET